MLPQDSLRRQRLLCILLAALASSCVAGVATAHPHVWATVRSEIVFGPDRAITGIRHHWTFDEFYTAMAVQGLDTDGDGVYSKAELEPLAKVNVESLKEFDYFTFVHLSDDDKLLPLVAPVDYSIDYDKSFLTLHFTLPLERPLDPRVHDVAIDVYDPSFFVAFAFATDSPIKISGPAEGCAAAIQKPGPEAEADVKALGEAFFSQLGPNANFGSQFARTAIVKCTTQ